MGHLRTWTDKAVGWVEDTTRSAYENTVDFVRDPIGWTQETWDDLWEDIKDEWDVFKEEFSWTGFGVALFATGMGIPAPFAMQGIFGLDTYQQSYDIMRGKYHEEMSDIADLQEELEALGDVYDGLYDDLLDLYLFWDEIYIMSASNEMDRYHKDVITVAETRLQKKVDDFNERYSDIIRLNTDSVIGKITLSGTMIIGGVVTDIGHIFDGDLPDEDRWKAAGRIIMLIIAIVVLVLTWGSETMSWQYIIGLVAFYISLDAGYGANGIMSAVLTVLDLVVNDILDLDEILNLKELSGLDKDSEYHQQMIGYSVTIVQLTAVSVSLFSSWTSTSAGKSVSPVVKDTLAITGSIQKLYSTYMNAVAVYDFYTANDALTEAQKKIQDGIEATNKRMENTRRMRLTLQMRDMRYIQSDADEIINNFVLNVSEGRSEYLDPEGSVRMNTRYKQEAMVQYGFEELFSSANIAGEDEYYKNILYST